MRRLLTRRRIWTVLAVVAASASASLTLAASAGAAVVLVTDAAIVPETVVVSVGDKVTWQNEGSMRQLIRSRGRPTFEDLSVSPGQDGSRRFRRPGRYRYEAAGDDGVVKVVGLGGRSPRSRGRGCDRVEIHRYDVRISGSKSIVEEWLPEFRTRGRFSISYRYSARFRNVALSVDRSCDGGARLELPAGRRGHPGSASLTSYAWSDTVQDLDDNRPPTCGFNVARTNLGAEIRRTPGFIAPRSRGSSFFFAAALTSDQSTALAMLLGNRRDAQCDRDPGRSNSRVFDGLPGYDASSQRGAAFSRPLQVGGLKLDPPSLGLGGSFALSRRNAASAVLRLFRGRSAAVRSGVQHLNDTSTQTRAVGRAQVTIRFVRRR